MTPPPLAETSALKAMVLSAARSRPAAPVSVMVLPLPEPTGVPFSVAVAVRLLVVVPLTEPPATTPPVPAETVA